MHPVQYTQEDFGRAPLMFYYEVTQACDLVCKHCRASAQEEPDPLELTTAQSKALIDQVASFPRRPTIVMTGGDPLKRRDLFDLIQIFVGDFVLVIGNPDAPAVIQTFNVRAGDTQKNIAHHDVAAVLRAHESIMKAGLRRAEIDNFALAHSPCRGLAHPKDLDAGRNLTKSGAVLIGENGSILQGTYCQSPRLIPESRMKDVRTVEKTIPRVPAGPYREWTEACKGTGPLPGSNFEYSVPLTEMVLLGNLAIRSGKKIEWDSERRKVTNVRRANKYLGRKARIY